MMLHLTPALEQKLEHLAAETHRTPDDLAQEAVDRYLKHIEMLTEEVCAAEATAMRDGWLSHEEVFARVHERLLKSA